MERKFYNRLKKLADHLMRGKLGHVKFDFSTYHRTDVPYPVGKCGFSGCAIGECPVVFPRHWKFAPFARGVPAPKLIPMLRIKNIRLGSLTSAMTFFGLDAEEASRLFLPRPLFSTEPNEMPAGSTRRQVGARIRRFLVEKTHTKTPRI